MAQEDESHDRHEILIAGIVGIGAESVRCVPKSLFNGFDIFKLGHKMGFSLGGIVSLGHGHQRVTSVMVR